MKKWLCFLLAFGLMTTPVWAQDDDDEYEDEEEEAPKKKAAPKKAKKESSGESRMGFAVSLGGSNGNDGRSGAVSFVYDMSGLELGLGLGLYMRQYTPPVGDAFAQQTIAIVPSISYNLGKGLLDYGIGVDLAAIMEPTYSDDGAEITGGTSIDGFLNFYVKADLVQNVSLKLSTGVSGFMPAAETNGLKKDASEMQIRLRTQGSLIFYFM
jgi:hypothetical protein